MNIVISVCVYKGVCVFVCAFYGTHCKVNSHVIVIKAPGVL